MRIRTVEYEPGWGWIARDPRTGKEVIHDFRWSSRAIARQVVSGVRHMAHSEVSRECERLGAFYVGTKTYTCQIKGGQHGTE